MNLGNDRESMSTASSSVVVSDQFPAGLRVLVVDDDPTCLRILEKMLRTCLYEGNIQVLFLEFSVLFLSWVIFILSSDFISVAFKNVLFSFWVCYGMSVIYK